LRNELAGNGRRTVLAGFTQECSARHVCSIISSVLRPAESTDIARNRVALTVSERGDR
jgi:hypothetical protein